MSKKRIFSLLICAILMSSAVTGCSGGEDTAQTTPVTEAEVSNGEQAADTEKIAFDVTGIDYEGYEFRIWNFDNYNVNTWDPKDIPNDMYSAELTGDVLNDAVFTRNKNVEEALNIRITVEDRNDGTMDTGLQQAVAGGSQDVDILFPRLYSLPTYVNKGYLMNLNNVDFRDTNAPWWNAEANAVLDIYGKQFGMVSDITYQDKVCTIVTYFNKQMAADYQLGDLYETVINDEWTLDNLLSMGEAVSADINGDGTYNTEDAYPLSCQNDAVYCLLHGGGIRFCENDADGSIALALTSEQAVSSLQKIYEIMGNQQMFFNRQTFSVSLQDAVNMFCENRAMFLIRPIQSLFLMRDMEADFGILPVPKLNENQASYGTAVNPYAATFMCWPVIAADTSRSAVVSEMMAWESHYNVIDPLYENILGSKLIRDDGASAMLDIVFDNIVYDIGLIWNFNDMSTKLLTNKDTNVASLLAGMSGAIESGIAKLQETVADMD